MSRSISSGWGVVRSCGRTPTIASTRRPRSSMRSGPGTACCDCDELAPRRAHLALDESLDHRRRARTLGHESAVHEVAAHHAEEPVTELVGVHEDLVAGCELRL